MPFDIRDTLNYFPVYWQLLLIIPVVLFLVYSWSFLIRPKNTAPKITIDPVIYAREKIANLSLEDPLFTQKLDFIVRKYLELTGTIIKGTRKTATEISKREIKENTRTFIMLTNRYKFAPENVSQEEKENLLRMARGIIE